MNKNSDEEWLDDVMVRYQWPEPSSDLAQKIINKASPYKSARHDPISAFLGSFSCDWQPVLATGIVLVLGICAGNFMLARNSFPEQVGLYMDPDFVLAQSIITHYRQEAY